METRALARFSGEKSRGEAARQIDVAPLNVINLTGASSNLSISNSDNTNPGHRLQVVSNHQRPLTR
jgi:hypothetical protein